jgi:hypothetical protein
MWSLCSSADVQEISRGRFEINDDQLPALDDFWIPAATESLAFACNRDFDKKDRTGQLSINEHRYTAFIPNPPIDSTQIIEIWESHAIPRTYNANSLLILNTDYIVHYNEGSIERLRGRFCTGPNVLTSGILTGQAEGVPADLRMIAAEQSFLFFHHRDQFGITGRSLEGGSVSLSAITLPTPLKMMLQKYIVPLL